MASRVRTTSASLLVLAGLIGTATVGRAAAAPTAAAPVAIGATSAFEAVGPLRLADTRRAVCGCDRPSPTTIRVPIAGRHGIAPDIVAAAVTITATASARPGFVTAFPAGAVRPATSTLNLPGGADTSNSTIVPVGAGGAIDLYLEGQAQLIVDVTGVLRPAAGAAAGRFVPAAPTRLLDTRTTTTTAPVPGTTVTVPLPPGVATDARALVVNVTSTEARRAGYVTGAAAGSPSPPTSFMNLDGSGRAKAASVVLPVSPQGLAITTMSGGQLIIDLVGWFTGPSAPSSADGLFVPVSPTRLLDTRSNAPRLWPGGTRELAAPVAGAGALVTNVTLDRPDAPGFVAAYPAGTPRPGTSSVNAVARDATVSNFAVTPLSARGTAYFSSGGTDLIVDLTGYFTGAPGPAPLPVPPNQAPSLRGLLVGDSTLGALNVTPASQSALRGFQPIVDAQPCRRLQRPSCKSSFTLRIPNTAVQAIGSTTGVLDVVVVKTGYNDGSGDFGAAVAAVVGAARAKGARWVVWLTYSEGTGSQLATYDHHNAVLRSLAGTAAYPDLVVADWRGYAARTSGWYASDRVHLVGAGAWATTDYVSRWIAHLTRRPCPMPWRPGGTLEDPCPNPDAAAWITGAVPDLRGLYRF